MRLEINNEYLMRTDTNEFTLDLKEYIIQELISEDNPSNTFNLVALKVVWSKLWFLLIMIGSPNNRNPVSVALSPFGWLFTIKIVILYWYSCSCYILVYGGLFGNQSGEGSSQIKHATVAGEEPYLSSAFIQGICCKRCL